MKIYSDEHFYAFFYLSQTFSEHSEIQSWKP